MHYKLYCEVTEEAIKNFTEVMIQMYEEHKNDEFFLKEIEKNKQ